MDKDIIAKRYKAIAKLLTEINEQEIVDSAKSIDKVEEELVTLSCVTTNEGTRRQKMAGEEKTTQQMPNQETPNQRMLTLKNLKFWLERLKYNVRPTYTWSGCTPCFTCCSMYSFCGCSMSENNERNMKFSVNKYWVLITSSLHYLLELVQT